jgi:uncharacterized protein YfiM (DUF2279 family)
MNKIMPICLIFVLLLVTYDTSALPPDSIHLKKRLKTVSIAGASAYTAGMTGLYFVWYAQAPQTSFHFFDDSQQWKQMDKVGHAYTGYQLARCGDRALRWAGLSDKKSVVWGNITGFGLLTTIEIFDGFSAEYGASWSDIIANASGVGLYAGQQLFWKENRIIPKFSFFSSPYAAQRPQLLGSNLPQQLLKDYNAQTYWVSGNISAFLPHANRFPKWFCISLGYSADGMIYANDAENIAAGYAPMRQYYLSFDVDFEKIPTKNKWIKSGLFFLNMLKVPAPTLLLTEKGKLKGYWIYF